MKSSRLLKKLKLTEEGLESIREAVRSAEASTSGEIAVAVTGESANYSFNELLASLIAGGVVSALLIFFHTPVESALTRYLWHIPGWVLPALYGSAGLATTALFFFFANVPAIDRLIIPQAIRQREVYNRALRHFVESGVYSTKDRTGILVFTSLMEREVRIIADTGIAAKIAPEVWQNISDTLAKKTGEGKFEEGLLFAIRECGTLLANHFPRKTDDSNELADGLAILEEN